MSTRNIVKRMGAALVFGMGLAALPASAPADVRYNVSGTACGPMHSSYTFSAESTAGLTTPFTVCPIPTGTELVTLYPSSNQIHQIIYSYEHSTQASLYSAIYVHDWQSDDWCSCASQFASVPAGVGTRNLQIPKDASGELSCGSCEVDAHYLMNLAVINFNGTNTTVRGVHVYDD